MSEPRTEAVHRAPLSPLETSRTDAIADAFVARGVEPNLADIQAMVPPIRYCTGDFRVYPLILGEKEFPRKVRLLSDASEIHLGIETYRRFCGVESEKHWFGAAMKVLLRVGADAAPPPTAQPTWESGFLPVACFDFTHQDVRYSLRAFGALLPGTSEGLCVWLRVGMKRLKSDAVGRWELRLAGEEPLQAAEGYLYHGTKEESKVRGGFSDAWRFDPAGQSLAWELPSGEPEAFANVVLLDQPPQWTLMEEPSRFMTHDQVNRELCLVESGEHLRQYAQDEWWLRRHRDYVSRWRGGLAAGAVAEVPESYVNHAQQSARVSSWIIATRDQMNYSAHNAYERVYSDEACQAIVGMASWGHFADAARYLDHLPFYTQKEVETHEFGTRLHWFCRYVALSGDRDFLGRNLPRMRRWAQWLLDDLKPERHGLASPTGIAGDLHHIKVFSLSSNCLAWRGIRDLAVLTDDAAMLQRAARYREDIRRAATATLDAKADPPFMPMSLYGQEKTPEHLMENSLSCYWCLMAPYALFSDALGVDHPGTRAIIETYRRRGGLCGGLVKFTGHSEFGRFLTWEEFGIDDLYGAKLCEAFARLDEPEQLVLALYGKLALGLTPDTFYGGESSSLVPTHVFDANCTDGRSTFIPPNTASQMFLATLVRHMLVFDFDSAEDGRYDTLRLAFSTPRAWLEDGKKIAVRGLPTAFGPVTYSLVSRLNAAGVIDGDVEIPSRTPPRRVLLRLRAPKGFALDKVSLSGRDYTRFDAANATIDLSGLSGRLFVQANFRRVT